MNDTPRCWWEVRGGILPGATDPEYTKRFVLTADEYNYGKFGLEPFLLKEAEANAYALSLQIQSTVGRGPNWTAVEFVWL